jgi:hypothetical protein
MGRNEIHNLHVTFVAYIVPYLPKAGIGEAEKLLLLGNGCVTCNNTRTIRNNGVTVQSDVFNAVRAEVS